MISNRGMLSVIMPAYNEGEHIYKNLLITDKVVAHFIDKYEIVVVNDGSKDQTAEEIKKAMGDCPNIHGVFYDNNGGKGKAIKKGVEAAKGKYIAFLDADLDLHPKQLKRFMKPILSGDADVVIGSKMHKKSKINYPFVRKCISFGYYVMLKILFRLNTKDTQTGIKLFKSEVIKSIIPLIQTKGFAYDIEILAAVNRRGYRIKEMPIELNFTRKNGMGRIKFSDILIVVKDTFSIFYRMYFKKYYDLESEKKYERQVQKT